MQTQMADTKFSIDDNNQLINLVKENALLYELQSELYKNSNVRDNI